MQGAFRCDRLGKSFGGTVALDSVSFSLKRGEILAIIGRNGAGKSTLVNIASGFISADTGMCYLEGTDITGWPPYKIVRRGMARTYQESRVITRLAIYDNVLLAMPRVLDRRSGIGGALGVRLTRCRASSREILRLVGLESICDRLAGDLSYGERKLLSIACCLATGARILLMDEPVAGIHPEMRLVIGSLLRQLSEAGFGILLIEHDLDFVCRFSRSAILMDKGRAVGSGAPTEILRSEAFYSVYI